MAEIVACATRKALEEILTCPDGKSLTWPEIDAIGREALSRPCCFSKEQEIADLRRQLTEAQQARERAEGELHRIWLTISPSGSPSPLSRESQIKSAWNTLTVERDAANALLRRVQEELPHSKDCPSLTRVHQPGLIHYETDAAEPCPDYHFRHGRCNCVHAAITAQAKC